MNTYARFNFRLIEIYYTLYRLDREERLIDTVVSIIN